MKKIFLFLFFWIFCFSNERIVLLSPALNEIVFALGKGENIVGNTAHSDYPEKSKKIYKIGGYFSPSLEKIVSLNPTLVIMQENELKTKKELEKLGINTLMIEITSIKSIQKAILDIGNRLGAKEKASEISKKIDKAILSLKALPRTDKKILIVFGMEKEIPKDIYIAGNNLYFSEMIELAGVKNAFFSTSAKQPVLSLEGLISLNPEILIVLSPFSKKMQISKDEIKKTWASLPINAAKKGSIYVIDEDYSSMPSDRIVLFLDHFRKIIEND